MLHLKNLLNLACWLLLLLVHNSSVAMQDIEISYQIDKELITTGRATAIVGLNVPFHPEGQLTSEQIEAQRAAIYAAQAILYEELVAVVPNDSFAIKGVFPNIPFIVLEVDESALWTLQTNFFSVSSIEANVRYQVNIEGVLAQIGMQSLLNIEHQGYQGEGQVIALPDTGVDVNAYQYDSDTNTTKPLFPEGILIHAACFSSSGCPNGLSSQIGGDAAQPCPLSMEVCKHGTGVASILRAVAPKAQIIPIQIAEIDESKGILFFTTFDLIRALNYLYDLHSAEQVEISSINLSLGTTDNYSYSCSGDAYANDDSLLAIIQNLRSLDIPVIAAAGNESQIGKLNKPACYDEVVSVSALDENGGILPIANRSPLLDLYAPGVATVVLPDGEFYRASGTSVAAPFVTGLITVLKAITPYKTAQELIQIIKNVGDTVDGIPTLKADAAARAVFSCDLVTEIPVEQCNTLVNLFDQIGGEQWFNKSSWKLSLTPCSWSGVVCDAQLGQQVIVELHLNAWGLKGYLSNLDLSGLANLRILEFQNNELIGNVSSWCSWLPELNQLNVLDLSANQLAGEVSACLATMPALQQLYLQDNLLAGPIYKEIDAISTVNLDNNAVCRIPPGDDYSQFSTFPVCDADSFDCNLVTEIPRVECQVLEQLYDSTFGDNWTDNNNWKATRTPCSWLGVGCEAGRVTELSLSNNNLTGRLPSLSRLNELKRLQLDNNAISGEIPALNDLYRLIHIDLSHNNFAGNIPPVDHLNQMTYFDLGHNDLEGGIPNLLAIDFLEHLDLAHNQLSGKIPNLSSLTYLQRIFLQANNFSGAVPPLNNLVAVEPEDLSLDDNPLLCRNTNINYGVWEAELETLSVCSSSCLQGHVDDLVVCLSFDDHHEDDSGYGHSISASGHIAYTQGVIGKALQLNGTDTVLDLPFADSLLLEQAFTISFFLKPEYPHPQFDANNPQPVPLLVKEDEAWLWLERYGEGNLRYQLFFQPSGVAEVTAPLPITASQAFFHVAIVRDGAVLQLYINGELQSEQTITGDVQPALTHLYIGGDGNKLYPYYAGLLDELRIYKQVLPITEVYNLYRLGIPETVLFSITPAEHGQVVTEDSAIECDITHTKCQHDQYLLGQTIEVSAIPASGYHFLQWEGDCSGEDKTIQVKLDMVKNCQARFVSEVYSVKVSKTLLGGIISAKVGDVGGWCSASCPGREFVMEYGQKVVIQAFPDNSEQKGYRFVGWQNSADCPLAANDHYEEVTVTQPITCVAEFEYLNLTDFYDLDIIILGSGQVDLHVFCAEPFCTVQRKAGEDIYLRAVPDEGMVFQNWNGCTFDGLKESAEIRFQIEQDTKCVVSFSTPTLTLEEQMALEAESNFLSHAEMSTGESIEEVYPREVIAAAVDMVASVSAIVDAQVDKADSTSWVEHLKGVNFYPDGYNEHVASVHIADKGRAIEVTFVNPDYPPIIVLFDEASKENWFGLSRAFYSFFRWRFWSYWRR